MPAQNSTTQNGKVSTAEFYKALLGIKDEMAAMERRIIDKLDCAPSPKEFELLKDSHDDLSSKFEAHREKDKKVDSALSLATVIGTILGVIFGQNR